MDLLLGVFQAAVIVSTSLGFHLKPQLGENLLLISFRLLAEFIFFCGCGTRQRDLPFCRLSAEGCPAVTCHAGFPSTSAYFIKSAGIMSGVSLIARQSCIL